MSSTKITAEIGNRELHHPIAKFVFMAVAIVVVSIGMLFHPVLRVFGRRGFINTKDDHSFSIKLSKEGFAKAA